MSTTSGVDARVGRTLASHLLPSRPWPLMVFGFAAPLCVGLSFHAYLQLDRWLLLWSMVIGFMVILVGSLPATFTDEPGTVTITQRAGGDRRRFAMFLTLGSLALLIWQPLWLRLTLGVPSLLVGMWYLVSLGRQGTSRDDTTGAFARHVIPWCYALGPAGAVALAALAMRPTHLGEWRDIVYLGLGRGAALAAIFYAIVVESEIRRRLKRSTEPAPDNLLPTRILILLLALTGPLVPGGGSPYAVSWAVAWLVVAFLERRLRIG